MSFSATVTPGHQFAPSDALQIPLVNLLGQPTIDITGGLADASDAAIVSPSSGQTLVWNATSSKWVNSDSGVINQTFRNLRVYPNGITPATQIDITADNIVLSGTGNVSFILRSFTATINALNNGVNGLDKSSLAVGWYYVWAISNGTSNYGILSLEDNQTTLQPNLPSGYTYKARLGAVYYTGSAFRRFNITERETVQDRVIFTLPAAAAASVLVTTALTTFLTAVPPRATECWGVVGTISDHPCQIILGMATRAGGIPADSTTVPLCDSNIIAVPSCGSYLGEVNAATGGWYAAGRFRVKLWPGTSLETYQNIVYRMRNATPTYNMQITGYSI